MSHDITINGVRLLKTSNAFPEQYDAFFGAVQIGYLRLRHGYFCADYPDCGGETVYEASPKGDGVFDDDEREGFLTAAVNALLSRHAGDLFKRPEA